MKAEETRKKLISEINKQFSKVNSYSAEKGTQEGTLDEMMAFKLEKPKMFEPNQISNEKIIPNTLDIQTVKGIGFKSSGIAPLGGWNKPKEIYSMKELIDSNPENMQTFSYDTKTVKAQVGLIKRKDWQDILFSDVDLFQPIEFGTTLKKIFKF